MTTISTQTDCDLSDINNLFKFKEDAEDVCSSYPVMEGLMDKIQEQERIIRDLENKNKRLTSETDDFLTEAKRSINGAMVIDVIESAGGLVGTPPFSSTDPWVLNDILRYMNYTHSLYDGYYHLHEDYATTGDIGQPDDFSDTIEEMQDTFRGPLDFERKLRCKAEEQQKENWKLFTVEKDGLEKEIKKLKNYLAEVGQWADEMGDEYTVQFNKLTNNEHT